MGHGLYILSPLDGGVLLELPNVGRLAPQHGEVLAGALKGTKISGILIKLEIDGEL